jgi:dUTP pyrophosphatase
MTNNITLEIKKISKTNKNTLPTYQTKCAAGMDLQAAIKEKIMIDPGKIELVPTGISISLPSGHEAQIRPRSGLAAKFGVTVLNSPGTIDSDYRGEIKVILINHGDKKFEINDGDRIAQMIIAPVIQAVVIEVEELDTTDRGTGGFGSTGRA